MLLGAAVLAAPWGVYMGLNGVVNPAFDPVSFGTLARNIGRVGTIAGMEGSSLLSDKSGYIWPISGIAGLLLWLLTRTRVDLRATAFMPLAAALYTLLTGSSYIFSAFVPYEEHIANSIDPLLLQVTPILLIWLLLLPCPQEQPMIILPVPR